MLKPILITLVFTSITAMSNIALANTSLMKLNVNPIEFYQNRIYSNMGFPAIVCKFEPMLCTP